MNYKAVKLSSLLLGLALAACSDSNAPAETPTPGDDQAQQPTEQSFLVIGDMGTGDIKQLRVAAAMEQVCGSQGCDFVIATGDNIYETGVKSVDDAQFQSKFETPYENFSIPFFLTLGNHDNTSLIPGVSTSNQRGDFQVLYAASDEAIKNGRWKMPARYYQVSLPYKGRQQQIYSDPLIDLFSIDSSPLTGVMRDLDPDYQPRTYKKVMQQWMDAALEQSQARWKFAFAHHPYLSNGKHGNAGHYDVFSGTNNIFPYESGWIYKKFLEETVCRNQGNQRGVNVYFSGHDHDLQWLKSVEPCSDTQLIHSGAAGKARPFKDAQRNEVYWQKDLTLGFYHIKATNDQLQVKAYTLDPEVENAQPQLACEGVINHPTLTGAGQDAVIVDCTSEAASI
ncbi:metallophosphoesterase [Pelagibaculum spongiae]|uniref:Acid phosphatase n=1 Tax=Pelagibaculum spongiae TaxID=2080658 RepID=A0A2V1GYU6_9GAMM|nr:metallophosphoesterase [Pelagibaculum spongiae]PVZ67692.1 acid phosphatase [Pelagibaculum spongiae]